MPESGVSPHKKLEGIFRVDKAGRDQLATLSLAPGTTVYGEETVIVDGREYRLWDPYRSKLAAAIKKGLSRVPIRPGSKVLYLGASSGTTASHVSDIIGSKGLVYCVEFAQRSFRDLVNNVCKERRNMIPIFGDARFPVRYRSVVQTVNAVYSDVAQPDQARILSENLDSYLEEKGEFLMAVKARSIDQSREPTEIYSHEKSVLETRGYRVSEMVRLDPFEKDHCMFEGSR